VTETPIHAPGIWGAYPDIVYPGRYIVEGGQTSTGSIIAWLRRFAGGNLDLAALNEKAAQLKPGADGLIVQDHFQGTAPPTPTRSPAAPSSALPSPTSRTTSSAR